MTTDTQIIDWLQHMHNLHTQVEAVYVVDGYQVSLTWDDNPVHQFTAPTLREAYIMAMAYEYRGHRFVKKLPSSSFTIDGGMMELNVDGKLERRFFTIHIDKTRRGPAQYTPDLFPGEELIRTMMGMYIIKR